MEEVRRFGPLRTTSTRSISSSRSTPPLTSRPCSPSCTMSQSSFATSPISVGMSLVIRNSIPAGKTLIRARLRTSADMHAKRKTLPSAPIQKERATKERAARARAKPKAKMPRARVAPDTVGTPSRGRTVREVTALRRRATRSSSRWPVATHALRSRWDAATLVTTADSVIASRAHPLALAPSAVISSALLRTTMLSTKTRSIRIATRMDSSSPAPRTAAVDGSAASSRTVFESKAIMAHGYSATRPSTSSPNATTHMPSSVSSLKCLRACCAASRTMPSIGTSRRTTTSSLAARSQGGSANTFLESLDVQTIDPGRASALRQKGPKAKESATVDLGLASRVVKGIGHSLLKRKMA